ncbi:ATP-dependent metallopeptidase FtsH/Yme1/Tma family protein, partial [Deinococcus yavapaiensis]
MKQGTWVWWLLGAVVAVIVIVTVAAPRPDSDAVSLSTFANALDKRQVQVVTLTNEGATVALTGNFTTELRNGARFETRTFAGDPLIDLDNLNAKIPQDGSVNVARISQFSWVSILSTLLTIALIGVLLIYLLRGNRGGGAGDAAGNFGKSRAHMLAEGSIKLSFSDVAGCDEAKADLVEVVEFLKNPERFHSLGARIP